MRKLSVFYEHILQACEQSGKTIPEVLAFCREQGISAVEMNYSLFASEREVIAPMLSDAGLVISCMHETFDFSHDTDLGRAQQMLDTAASQQVSRVLFVAGALETAEAAELAACSSTYEATSTFMTLRSMPSSSATRRERSLSAISLSSSSRNRRADSADPSSSSCL